MGLSSCSRVYPLPSYCGKFPSQFTFLLGEPCDQSHLPTCNLDLAMFTSPQSSLPKRIFLISRLSLKETPSVAEIAFLLGEQWWSSAWMWECQSSEWRQLFSPMLLSREEELASKRQAAALPLMLHVVAMRGHQAHLGSHSCGAGPEARAQDSEMCCRGSWHGGIGKKLVTPGF